MKSSTEPSCKKQFIWFFGTPSACQLNALPPYQHIKAMTPFGPLLTDCPGIP
jgi:hypothetical protein